ncbi:pilus assembly protein PilP [Massilia sp. DWR3-1-1]|uniref:pilus assembly protein PilP n=1 Tax=Massilia sp. DWR3-1-1 TaxID=2804559 RepID=UPI003CF056CB
MMRPIRLCVLAAALLLAGCGASNVHEVQTWMDQVKRDTKVSVKPIAEPKTFIPFAYMARESLDPFTPNKLLAELARVADTNVDRLKPDMARRKEVLENYPLDTLSMVGTMQKAGVNYALLQLDRQVYQVRAGQRIGQNFGTIIAVGESAVSIKEVVQDAGGEWVERLAKLELQESKESKK